MKNHRPLLTMTWEHLLFLHWEADAEQLQAALPEGLELDTYDGKAYLGIIPFFMTDIALQALPRLSRLQFPELNLRTYVKKDGRRGIYFFYLDASHVLANRVANTAFQLPYRRARFDTSTAGPIRMSHYHPKSRSGIDVSWQGAGPVFRSEPASFAHWATERYHFFTKGAGLLWRGDVSHAPWTLQEADVDVHHENLLDHWNTGSQAPAFYGRKIAVTAERIRRV
ncbi:YqjF family protein [Alkalicoccus chagannorensis]|uniref:YqjF family protein n=1 Tax=Alkalicoccus chagannorensis TaxID=427072 RepID=UPI0004001528|nr:DUF2071 domain-containing protein [Alkalicoccus chagannorensis]